MRHTAFVEFVAQLKQLTPEQRKQLVRQLMGRESAPVPHATAPLPAPTGCPHCSAAVAGRGIDPPTGLELYIQAKIAASDCKHSAGSYLLNNKP